MMDTYVCVHHAYTYYVYVSQSIDDNAWEKKMKTVGLSFPFLSLNSTTTTRVLASSKEGPFLFLFPPSLSLAFSLLRLSHGWVAKLTPLRAPGRLQCTDSCPA